MIRFLEEVHQKQGAQSARRTLMNRWFERPLADTSTIYMLTVYSPFFCKFHIEVAYRGKSSRCRGKVGAKFPTGFYFRHAVVFWPAILAVPYMLVFSNGLITCRDSLVRFATGFPESYQTVNMTRRESQPSENKKEGSWSPRNCSVSHHVAAACDCDKRVTVYCNRGPTLSPKSESRQ
jgi:hypothetical protein